MKLLFILFVLFPVECFSQASFKTEKDILNEIIVLINKEYSILDPNDRSKDLSCVIFDDNIKMKYFPDSIPLSKVEIKFGEHTLAPIGKYYVRVEYPVLSSDYGVCLALGFYIRESEKSFLYSFDYFYSVKQDPITKHFTLTFIPPFSIPTERRK